MTKKKTTLKLKRPLLGLNSQPTVAILTITPNSQL